ncbi:MAG: hypothetical protein HY235_02160 [Acidobacteria bacterium]|nr:hypothetical protein [Acidobacteriota bacterium]
MADRQDALIAASHLTLAVREIVTREPGRQVGTVGELNVAPNASNVIPGKVQLVNVAPNASNVIPGKVQLGFELRDLSSEKLRRLAESVERRA